MNLLEKIFMLIKVLNNGICAILILCKISKEIQKDLSIFINNYLENKET